MLFECIFPPICEVVTVTYLISLTTTLKLNFASNRVKSARDQYSYGESGFVQSESFQD